MNIEKGVSVLIGLSIATVLGAWTYSIVRGVEQRERFLATMGERRWPKINPANPGDQSQPVKVA